MAAEGKLAGTLDAVAEAAALLQDPWWIIGSTAAFLIGLDEQPADVDLLTSEADAHRLLRHWGLEPAPPSPSLLFHSVVFATAGMAPLPIEVMGDLHVRAEPLVPRTRLAVPWRDRLLHVPALGEQIAILERFGRDKDLRRAERLRALL
jgi:hypothetical protein